MSEPLPPVTLPRALARYDRLAIACSLAAIPLAAALLVAIELVGKTGWIAIGIAYVSVTTLQLIGCSAIGRARRRVIRRAMSADGLLCTVCLYQLQPDSPRCPECGQHTSAHQCRLVWMECC